MEEKKEYTEEEVKEIRKTIDYLIPQAGEFKLKATGKTYSLRIISLEDKQWVKENLIDKEHVYNMVAGEDLVSFAKMVYRLLDQEGRSDFLKTEIEEIDDEGVRVKKVLSGPELLARSIDQTEVQDVYKAFLKTVGVSDPVLAKIELEVVKKKESEIAKLLTGGKSSNSSPENTAGP